MWRLAVRSMLAKRLRLLSTALSVVIGIAFLSGTLVFTDTLRNTFDDLFADVFADTDSYVRSADSIELEFGESHRGRIAGDLVDTVRGVEGVADAQPIVQGFAQIVGADGDPIGDPGNGPPTFAMTYAAGDLSPWRLTPGSAAPGAGELVVDVASADAGKLEIGDDVTVMTQTGPHVLRLVGTVTFGSVDSPGGASVSLLDLATSQQLLLGGADEVDAIMVDAAQGVDQATLTARIGAVLPQGVEAITGAEITDEAQSTMREAMSFFNTFLLVFAAIGLVVACFTIYNTFQIVVSQRTREMALLRSVGATRSQVLGAQLVEAALLGVVASLVGLAAGVGVTKLLQQMLVALGIDLPGGETVFAARTAIVALVVGSVVTILAAVFPSIRAARTPPLAAIRETSFDRSAWSVRRLIGAAALLTLGVAAYARGLVAGGIAWVGAGALLTLVAVFAFGPLAARPVSSVIGRPIEQLGVSGELARQNAMRNPKRTSRTGGALMVGVALVAAITVIAASVRDWTRDSFGELFSGDFVVSTDMFGFGGLSPELADRVSGLADVEAASGVRVGAAHLAGSGDDVRYVAIDPVPADRIFDLDPVAGDVAALSPSGILVDDDEADRRHVTLGDTITFQFLDGSTRRLTVEGIYRNDDVAGAFVVSRALHEATGVDQFDISVYILARHGADLARLQGELENVASSYPNSEVDSRSEYIDRQAAQFDPIVNLMYALLALAVLIALLNVGNSLALSIHERTHELGLLRAVGTTRTQTSVAVTLEALLIAVMGALVGIVVGTCFGWSVSVVGRGFEPGAFVLPVVPLLLTIVVAVVGAGLAAARPAWNAAHLDVLRAIATE